MLRASLIAFSVASLPLLACATRSQSSDTAALQANPTRPIPLGEWCYGVGKRTCARLGQCAGDSELVSGCESSARDRCLAGRDGSGQSGHVASELAKCMDAVDGLSCDGLVTNLKERAECQTRTIGAL